MCQAGDVFRVHHLIARRSFICSVRQLLGDLTSYTGENHLPKQQGRRMPLLYGGQKICKIYSSRDMAELEEVRKTLVFFIFLSKGWLCRTPLCANLSKKKTTNWLIQKSKAQGFVGVLISQEKHEQAKQDMQRMPFKAGLCYLEHSSK